MKTLDLAKQEITVDELLQSATDETILVRGKDGNEFVIEAADALDHEVAELSASPKFMAFLAERSKEAAGATLEEVQRRLAREAG